MIEVELELPATLALDTLVHYSNDFTITVDDCNPLPCFYNNIVLPEGDDVVFP